MLVEKPFTHACPGEGAVCVGEKQGHPVTPIRIVALTPAPTAKKAIESGKLGEIVEVESHFTITARWQRPKLGRPQDGAFYGLGVHTMGQIILVRSPGSRRYDIRSLRNKANPDHTFKRNCFMAT
ncbi:Gfo/Idh/MocA family oxidoreductase [Escherichia coli]